MTANPTPGPWDFVPANEHHGPYVTDDYGSTICDFYTMSRPMLASTANGGPSKPIPFLAEMAEPNARLCAAAPMLLEAAEDTLEALTLLRIGLRDRAPETIGVLDAHIDELRYAIAKARGQ